MAPSPVQNDPGFFEIVHKVTGCVYLGISENIGIEHDTQRRLFVRFQHPCKVFATAFERHPRIMVKIFTTADPMFRFNMQRCASMDQARRSLAGLIEAYQRRNVLLNAPEEIEALLSPIRVPAHV